MPSLTRSRLDEISKVIDQFESLVNGSGTVSPTVFIAFVKDLDRHVADVNAVLAEVRQLLSDGLRDEALSMHDPAFERVARRLWLQVRGDWTRVQALMLENALPQPRQVDIDAVEELSEARETAARLEHHLDALRRLCLGRASNEEKLPFLWDLRRLDGGNPLWPAVIEQHERDYAEEMRKRVPQFAATGDIAALAAVEAAFADARWQTAAAPDVMAAVSGAGLVQRLRQATQDATAAAADVAALTPGQHASSEATEQLITHAHRIEAAVNAADGLVAELHHYPAMMNLVCATGDDVACRKIRDGVAGVLADIRRIEADRNLRAAFATACMQLEHLCDNPPDLPGEEKWLADVQRAQIESRRCCQERTDLSIPHLLVERVQRAVGAVENRQALRRRYVTVVAVSTVVALLGITAIVSWWMWHARESERRYRQLHEAVEQARQGWFLERPKWLEAYDTDDEAHPLIAEIDAAIQTEVQRSSDFEQRVADIKDSLVELAAAVDARREMEAEGLSAWPEAYGQAVNALANARRSGWQTGNRESEKAADQAVPAGPKDVRDRFAAEEKRLAAEEDRLKEYDQMLELRADEAVRKAVDALRKRLTSAAADTIGELQSDIASLRSSAMADKIDGATLQGRRRQRASPEAVGLIDVVEKRLQVLGAEATKQGQTQGDATP